MTRPTLALLVATTLLAGCGTDASGESSEGAESPSTSRADSPSETPTGQGPGPGAGTPKLPTKPELTTPPPRGDEEPDPRWQFFTDDTSTYSSPWFPGRRRLMIDFGCTDAPFYDPSPLCTAARGSTTASTSRCPATPRSQPGGRARCCRATPRALPGRRTAMRPSGSASVTTTS